MYDKYIVKIFINNSKTFAREHFTKNENYLI